MVNLPIHFGFLFSLNFLQKKTRKRDGNWKGILQIGWVKKYYNKKTCGEFVKKIWVGKNNLNFFDFCIFWTIFYDFPIFHIFSFTKCLVHSIIGIFFVVWDYTLNLQASLANKYKFNKLPKKIKTFVKNQFKKYNWK